MGNGKSLLPIQTIATILAAFAPVCYADGLDVDETSAPKLAIVPQIGFVSRAEHSGLKLTAVSAAVEIGATQSTTTLSVKVHNGTDRQARPALLVPLPQGAAVSELNSTTGRATIVAGKAANRLMRRWIEDSHSTALLEFTGFNWLRATIPAIPPNASKTFQIAYRQPLDTTAERCDYVLPRSQLLSYRIPWSITARIRAGRAISTVYSPSHDLTIERTSSSELAVRTTASAAREPGAFRMSCLYDTGKLAATLFTSRGRSGGDGYFLILVGPPANPSKSIKREITFVIDRSASMKGERLDQVCASVSKLVSSMASGEAMNIIQYNDKIQSFAPSPIANTATTIDASKRYLKSISPRGGTNTFDALRTSLSQTPSAGKLPIVLFFTDGLPTIGNTSEAAIRKLVVKGNPHKRRVYTIGVGIDVKTPLLEGIAAASRGRATFVLPDENLTRKVADVVDRLKNPVLAEAALELRESDGTLAGKRVHDLQPTILPDLFHGDQLVVLGRYSGTAPLVVRLRGNYLGKSTAQQFQFNLQARAHENDFVRRLWASRKIARLIDEIRQSGANVLPSYATPKLPANTDVTSRVGEILRLTAVHGILTEYTAFAGRAPENWNKRKELMSQTVGNLNQRAVETRAGFGSVNQEFNGIEQKDQRQTNYRNNYWNAKMKRVAVKGVQQIGPDSFFRQNGVWVDGRLLNHTPLPKPKQTVSFGTAEYFTLLESLTKTHRQGALALPGNVLLLKDGNPLLVTGPRKRK